MTARVCQTDGLRGVFVVGILQYPVELRHIRYFLGVAETLNFSQAAQRLHVTQPALSRQIRELEDELGGRLFQRTTTKVTLTEMGHYFRQQTQRLAMQLDIAVTGAQQLAKGACGILRIGCDWRLGGLPIATAAKRFTESSPRITVQFIERPTQDHAAAIRDHVIDIGFVPSFLLGTARGLEPHHLFAGKMKVILPSGHRLAGRPRVTLPELKRERWLTLDTESVPGYGPMMAHILRFRPRFSLTTTSLPGLIANVIAGHGIGLVPETALGSVSKGVAVVDADVTPIDVFAIFPKEGASPLLPAFLDALDQALAAGRANFLPAAEDDRGKTRTLKEDRD